GIRDRNVTGVQTCALPIFSNPRSIALSVLLMFPGLQVLGADYQWENGPGYRRAKLQPVGAGKDGFTLLPGEQTGVLFTNYLSERSEERRVGKEWRTGGRR